ncbi:MAG: response regulator transcription factor [Clostridia bacterium]|nr:response regulator transcription factor [Clostridia bacterium]
MSNHKYRILVVEDDIGIANFIQTMLSSAGYQVLRAANGANAQMLITSHCPDLVILDLGLPDVDGINIIQAVREWSRMPIVVVSARTHEKDKVAALDMGADDYITKPFGSEELLARIRTALRHAAGSLQDAPLTGVFRAGELEVDYDKRRVYIAGQDARLTQNEFRIVALLSRYAGRVLTYDHIIREVWGPNSGGDNQILRVNMANIRRKIEKNPAEPVYIFTEIGVGYRMVEGA